MKNPPGRPPKDIANKRCLPVTTRFTPGEANQLDLFAREAGLTASEFIRTRALTSRPAPSISAELRNEIYRLLLALRSGAPKDSVERRLQAVLERLQT